jgi:hypothetical protein
MVGLDVSERSKGSVRYGVHQHQKLPGHRCVDGECGISQVLEQGSHGQCVECQDCRVLLLLGRCLACCAVCGCCLVDGLDVSSKVHDLYNDGPANTRQELGHPFALSISQFLRAVVELILDISLIFSWVDRKADEEIVLGLSEQGTTERP